MPSPLSQRIPSISHITISQLFATSSALTLDQINVTIEGMTFEKTITSKLIATTHSHIEFHGCIKIHKCALQICFCNTEIYLKESTTINFTHNSLKYVVAYEIPNHPIVNCPFQYLSNKHNLDSEFLANKKLNYSIIFESLVLYSMTNRKTTWCEWSSSSAFSQLTPLQVNNRYVHFINTSEHTFKKLVCLCNSSKACNCSQDKIGIAFPGQLVTINLLLRRPFAKLNKALIKNVDTKYNSSFVCDSFKKPVKHQLNLNKCKRLTYLVKHSSKSWCALSLSVTSTQLSQNCQWLETYIVQFKPCSKGFSLHPQGYCQCDPILSIHIPSLTTCDIDHQTIPRPADTWISAHTINNSHFYHVSLHRPFDYCLPHSSQLNLSTPDSQCQFNRSDVLCGQYQHGLSIVFGSSQCKHCSSIYLLIIIPIGIAGIILVMLMFLFNTDGNINSFLFYTNIVGINHSLFYPKRRSITYVLTSLANLDLGIEMCFYSGMNDYTKM